MSRSATLRLVTRTSGRAVVMTGDQRASEPAPESGGKPGGHTLFDDSPGSTHNRFVELVPDGASVLVFGRATDYMSEVVARRKDARVTGIELDPDAAAEAMACGTPVVASRPSVDGRGKAAAPQSGPSPTVRRRLRPRSRRLSPTVSRSSRAASRGRFARAQGDSRASCAGIARPATEGPPIRSRRDEHSRRAEL